MKKGTKEKATVTGATVLGAVGGAIINNLVSANVGKPKVEGSPTQKEMYTKGVVQLLLGVASGVGLFYIEGDDFGTNALKGLCAATAGFSTVSGLGSFAMGTPKVKEKLMAEGKITKVVRQTMGLNCPCERNMVQRQNPYALNRPKHHGRKLGYPKVEDQVLYTDANSGSVLYS